MFITSLFQYILLHKKGLQSCTPMTAQMPSSDHIPTADSEEADHISPDKDGLLSDVVIPARSKQGSTIAETGTAPADHMRVGLIDNLRFTQDCINRALTSLHAGIMLIPFSTISECIRSPLSELDLLLYYSHDDGLFETVAIQQIKTLRQTFPHLPIVVMSDARSAMQPRNIRNALTSGAQGFIPTVTTELSAVVAAMRFVRDGGTFAPLNLLLPNRSGPGGQSSATAPAHRLTPRQMNVLSHLRLGKANKIIAHDLGMTESTVKVHVRNIMRKMGATNRTQAVYKAQQLWSYSEQGSIE
jgi:DNA-binding NarL/FixJ family response regulator